MCWWLGGPCLVAEPGPWLNSVAGWVGLPSYSITFTRPVAQYWWLGVPWLVSGGVVCVCVVILCCRSLADVKMALGPKGLPNPFPNLTSTVSPCREQCCDQLFTKICATCEAKDANVNDKSLRGEDTPVSGVCWLEAQPLDRCHFTAYATLFVVTAVLPPQWRKHAMCWLLVVLGSSGG